MSLKRVQKSSSNEFHSGLSNHWKPMSIETEIQPSTARNQGGTKAAKINLLSVIDTSLVLWQPVFDINILLVTY